MAGFASTIFLPLASWLVDVQGWRTALLTLAAVLAAGTIPAHALLLRRRPEDMGLRVDGDPSDAGVGSVAAKVADVGLGTALRDRNFALLVVAFSLASIVAFGMAVHLVAILVDRGYEPLAAAGVTGLVGATQVLGRLHARPDRRSLSPAPGGGGAAGDPAGGRAAADPGSWHRRYRGLRRPVRRGQGWHDDCSPELCGESVRPRQLRQHCRRAGRGRDRRAGTGAGRRSARPTTAWGATRRSCCRWWRSPHSAAW